MAQQQVENLPAWFSDVSRFGEKGEYDRALKVVNRSKSLFYYLGGYCLAVQPRLRKAGIPKGLTKYRVGRVDL